MSQYYKIPKKEIDRMVGVANLGIWVQNENPKSEKSIEFKAILYALKLVIKNSTLENE